MKTDELARRLIAGLPHGPVNRGEADRILRRQMHGVTSKQIGAAIGLAVTRGQLERLCGGTVIAKCSMRPTQ